MVHVWKSKDNSKESVPAYRWAPGIELRLLGLLAGTFTHCTSPAIKEGRGVRKDKQA